MPSDSGETKEVILDFSIGERTILYKTKDKYYDKVPVVLSDNKRRIISYPHPKDVFYKGKLATPTRLINGYLLDNRGIGKNTAFLQFTYEHYAQLETAPELKDMENMIIDKDPIIELCDCGNRNQFKDEVEELNQLIKHNQLDKCKRMK